MKRPAPDLRLAAGVAAVGLGVIAAVAVGSVDTTLLSPVANTQPGTPIAARSSSAPDVSPSPSASAETLTPTPSTEPSPSAFATPSASPLGTLTPSGTPTPSTSLPPMPPVTPESSGCPATTGVYDRAPATAPRTVALTFDDGPSEFTPTVLAVLAKYNVPATFYVVGSRVQENPEILRQIVAQGHQVGSHSFNHLYPRDVPGGWTTSYLQRDTARTHAAISAVVGFEPCWFRPPGGFMTNVTNAAAADHLAVSMWLVDTMDWKVQDKATSDASGALRRQITAAATDTVDAHPVVLMHDGGGWRGATAASLGATIEYYRSRGYVFVRQDEIPPPPVSQAERAELLHQNAR